MCKVKNEEFAIVLYHKHIVFKHDFDVFSVIGAVKVLGFS